MLSYQRVLNDSENSSSLRLKESLKNVISFLKAKDYEEIEINIFVPYIVKSRDSSLANFEEYRKYRQLEALESEKKIKLIDGLMSIEIKDFYKKASLITSERKLYLDNWNDGVSKMFMNMLDDIKDKKSEGIFVIYVIDYDFFQLHGLDYQAYDIPYSNLILL